MRSPGYGPLLVASLASQRPVAVSSLMPPLVRPGLLGTVIRDLQAGLADPDHALAPSETAGDNAGASDHACIDGA